MLFKSSKNAFWEALVLTIIVFIIGIILGISFESSKLDKVNEYYALSEISLIDSLTFNQLSDTGHMTCEVLIESQIDFANRIYEEALLLEKFEESGKLTEGLKLAHRRYDLLRTLLWINIIDAPEECREDVSVVVYLYEFDTEDLAKKATQTVWSRVLFDLKQEKGNKVILIPIAVNTDLVSLDSLIDQFSISGFPVVIIDEKHVISKVSSVDDLKKYLK